MRVLGSSVMVAAALLTLAGTHPIGGGHAGSAQLPSAASRRCGQVSVKMRKSLGLPGVGGHGDVVRSDPFTRSIYISQSPDNNVVVLDTLTDTVRAVVDHVPDANGIDYSPRYVFVAEASSNRVAVISKRTWRVVATLPSGGTAPDAVYYDSRDHSVFVGNVTSNNMREISAIAPFPVIGTFPLRPADPNGGQDLGTYVRGRDRIYQSVDNTIQVVNAAERTVEKVFTLPLAPSESTKDIYFNREQHLLWVATSAAELLAVNPDTGAVERTVKTASGIDEVAADNGRNLLFLGESKAGVMGIVNMRTAKNIANVPTETGFHTLAYQRGNVYAYLNFANRVSIYDVDCRHGGLG